MNNFLMFVFFTVAPLASAFVLGWMFGRAMAERRINDMLDAATQGVWQIDKKRK